MNTTCFDVARYILEKVGTTTAMKLQKLVYYCQAWSLVWDGAPLFDEQIQAWINGPVIVVLYNHHKGKFQLNASDFQTGSSDKLSFNQKETIDKVLFYYGDKSSQWLSDLTHMEEPWKNARHGIPPNVRGSSEISLASMEEYYSSIPQQ